MHDAQKKKQQQQQQQQHQSIQHICGCDVLVAAELECPQKFQIEFNGSDYEQSNYSENLTGFVRDRAIMFYLSFVLGDIIDHTECELIDI